MRLRVLVRETLPNPEFPTHQTASLSALTWHTQTWALFSPGQNPGVRAWAPQRAKHQLPFPAMLGGMIFRFLLFAGGSKGRLQLRYVCQFLFQKTSWEMTWLKRSLRVIPIPEVPRGMCCLRSQRSVLGAPSVIRSPVQEMAIIVCPLMDGNCLPSVFERVRDYPESDLESIICPCFRSWKAWMNCSFYLLVSHENSVSLD